MYGHSSSDTMSCVEALLQASRNTSTNSAFTAKSMLQLTRTTIAPGVFSI